MMALGLLCFGLLCGAVALQALFRVRKQPDRRGRGRAHGPVRASLRAILFHEWHAACCLATAQHATQMPRSMQHAAVHCSLWTTDGLVDPCVSPTQPTGGACWRVCVCFFSER